MHPSCIWLVALIVIGCGGGHPTVTDSASSDAPNDATADGTPVTPVLPLCEETCNSGQDCSTGSQLTDQDNYTCVDHHCVFIGCASASECQILGGGTYVCETAPGDTIPSCTKTCDDFSQCGIGSNPLYSADNYDCTNHRCLYKGCTSAAECAAGWAGVPGDWRCEPPAPNRLPECVQACSSPSQCGNPNNAIANSNNYACTDARCHYIGCVSTAECQQAYTGFPGSYECVTPP